MATDTGGSVRLIDAVGERTTVPLSAVLADSTLEVLAGSRPVLWSVEALEGVPAEVADRARWWEQHIVEVLTGRRPESPPGQPIPPEFDPAVRSLRQRELAKFEELRATGHDLALITLQRQRSRYEAKGLLGLVDGRYLARRPVLGRVDERVVAVVRRLIDNETELSTGTVSRLQRKLEKALLAEYGRDDAPKVPSQATFYRLVKRLEEGKHTFGSARTRRSLAKQPDGPFGTVTAARPGEVVEIDSTHWTCEWSLMTVWSVGAACVAAATPRQWTVALLPAAAAMSVAVSAWVLR